jgi:phage gp36-like protein
MAYCTSDDILKHIPEPELAQLTAETGEAPDLEVVNDAIAAADAEIDSYLGVRYSLPLAAPAPARIKALSVDMAIYHLHSRRGIMPEVRRDKYKDAVAFLRDVAAGRVQVIGATGLEPLGDSENVVEVSSSERLFSRDKLRDW